MADETYPDDLRYHPAHDWARIDGEQAVFGVTWYAQDSLGDIVAFLPPAVGDIVTAGGVYGELESVKAVSEIVSPLAGEIVEVNPLVVDGPEIVNEDPYGEGWLVKVKLSDPASASELLDAAAYRATL